MCQRYWAQVSVVEIGSCGNERVPDNVPSTGRLTPYFTWENNPREHQSFGLAIYGTTYLFLEVLWGYFCKLSIYSVQKCLDGLWQVMYCFVWLYMITACSGFPSKIGGFLFLSLPKISFDLAEYTADVDGVGTLRLLDAIKTCGLINSVKFYQASTSELFGKVQEIPQKETTPFYPRSPYGEERWWCVCSVCLSVLPAHVSGLKSFGCEIRTMIELKWLDMLRSIPLWITI